MEFAQPLEYGHAQPVIVEEEDEQETFTYSRFALPWLLFSLLILLTVFCLTFWQQTGSVKDWFDGVPRVLRRQTSHDLKTEGGLKKTLRNTRIAVLFFGFVGIGSALLVFFARPKYNKNYISPSLLNYLCAGLLFVSAVLSWICFGLGIDQYRLSVDCEENYLNTFAKCRNRFAWALTAVGLNAAIGWGALTACILLAWNTKAGHWRLPARAGEDSLDDDVRQKERVPGEMVQRNVSYVRVWLTSLALAFTLLALIGLTVFIILLHEDRDVVYVRGARGRSDSSLNPYSNKPYEHAGWPILNTRIRYGATGVGILTIIFNFLPFTNRTIAYVLGFLYFTSAALLMIAFGFDIHKLRQTDKLTCPYGDNGERLICIKSSFVGTCFIEFFGSIALFLYLYYEYVVKEWYSTNGEYRAYAAHAQQKKEVVVAQPKMQDTPKAQVGACGFCGVTVQAQDGHQSVCPEMLVECVSCGDNLQRFKLEKHMQEDCPQRAVSCTVCGQSMPGFRLARHQAAGCQ